MPTLVGQIRVLGTCAATPYAFTGRSCSDSGRSRRSAANWHSGPATRAEIRSASMRAARAALSPSTGLKRAGARRLPTMASVGVECRAFTACRETSVQVKRKLIEVPGASVSTPPADWARCSADDGSLVPRAALSTCSSQSYSKTNERRARVPPPMVNH